MAEGQQIAAAYVTFAGEYQDFLRQTQKAVRETEKAAKAIEKVMETATAEAAKGMMQLIAVMQEAGQEKDRLADNFRQFARTVVAALGRVVKALYRIARTILRVVIAPLKVMGRAFLSAGGMAMSALRSVIRVLMELGRRVVAVAASLATLIPRALGQVRKALKDLREYLEGLTKRLVFIQLDLRHITELTRRYMLVVGAAVSAGVYSLVSFEQAFVIVRRVTDLAADGLHVLERRVRQLSTEIVTGANELATLAGVAGRLGLEGVRNLERFVEVVSALEITTTIAGEVGATQFARLTIIMGETEENMERMASTIVHLGNSFAAFEHEILDMSFRLAGSAKVIGMTTGEVLALSTALAAAGVRSERGGTAMARMMIEMADAVRQQTEVLDTFARVADVSAEEFAEVFRDEPMRAIEMFIRGLQRMVDAGEDVFGVLEEVGMAQIRTRDAVLMLTAAGEQLPRAIAEQSDEWERNTAMAEEVVRAHSTLWAQLRLVWDTLTEVARTLAEEYWPTLQEGVAFLRAFTLALLDMSPEQRRVILRFLQLTTAVFGLVTALFAGVRVMAVFGTALTLVARAIAFLGPAIFIAWGAFRLLGWVMGLYGEELTDIISVFDFFGERLREVTGFLEGLWKAFEESDEGRRFLEFLGDLRGEFIAFREDVSAMWEEEDLGLAVFGVDAITRFVEMLTRQLELASGYLQGFIERAAEGIREGISKEDLTPLLKPGLEPEDRTLIAAIWDFAYAVAEFFGTAFGEALQIGSVLADALWPIEEDETRIRQAAEKLAEWVWAPFRDATIPVMFELADWLDEIDFRELFEGVREDIKALDELDPAEAEFVDALGNLFWSFLSAYGRMWRDLIATLVSAFLNDIDWADIGARIAAGMWSWLTGVRDPDKPQEEWKRSFLEMYPMAKDIEEMREDLWIGPAGIPLLTPLGLLRWLFGEGAEEYHAGGIVGGVGARGSVAAVLEAGEMVIPSDVVAGGLDRMWEWLSDLMRPAGSPIYGHYDIDREVIAQMWKDLEGIVQCYAEMGEFVGLETVIAREVLDDVIAARRERLVGAWDMLLDSRQAEDIEGFASRAFREFMPHEFLLASSWLGPMADLHENKLLILAKAAVEHGLFPREEDIVASSRLTDGPHGAYYHREGRAHFRYEEPAPEIVAHEMMHHWQHMWLGTELYAALSAWHRKYVREVTGGDPRYDTWFEKEAYAVQSVVRRLLEHYHFDPSFIEDVCDRTHRKIMEASALQAEIRGYQEGGLVPGYGGGDRHLALLEAGEAVIPKEAVKAGPGGVLGFLGGLQEGLGRRIFGLGEDDPQLAAMVEAFSMSLEELQEMEQWIDEGIDRVVGALENVLGFMETWLVDGMIWVVDLLTDIAHFFLGRWYAEEIDALSDRIVEALKALRDPTVEEPDPFILPEAELTAVAAVAAKPIEAAAEEIERILPAGQALRQAWDGFADWFGGTFAPGFVGVLELIGRAPLDGLEMLGRAAVGATVGLHRLATDSVTQAIVVHRALNALGRAIVWTEQVFVQAGASLLDAVERNEPRLSGAMREFESSLVATVPEELADDLDGTLGQLIALGDVTVALVAVFGYALTQVESFSHVMAIVGNVVDMVLMALDPFVEAVLPLLYVLMISLAPLFQFLGSIIESLIIPVLKMLFPLFKAFGLAINILARIFHYVRAAILDAVGGLVIGLGRFVNSLIGLFSGVGRRMIAMGEALQDSAQDSRDQIEELAEQFAELAGLTWDEAMAKAKLVEETERATEAMRNVPQIFRAALRRWEAGGVGLQAGGLVTGPTRALIGEAGPEMVIPLDEIPLGGGPTFVFQGDVYGWDDFERRVHEAVGKVQTRHRLARFGAGSRGWR